MNPSVFDKVLFCSLALIISMYWAALMIKPGAWDNFTIKFIKIAAIVSVPMLMSLIIPKCLGRQVVEDLEVAAGKLSPVQTALRHLGPLRSSRCIEWLKSVNDLQWTKEEIKDGYDGCGLNYLQRLIYSYKADQMLYKANNLLRQGDNFLHPENHFRRTMNFYMERLICFIKATSNDSGGLLGIWGMGGVGKSSLLKLLFDSRSQYNNGGSIKVMFVFAGITCTVRQVQKDIAASIGLPVERNETSQEKVIREHLSGTSFLLLLDDLWGYLDLKAVGIPSPLGTFATHLQGGLVRQICQKVILTTRTTVKCIQMGCHNTIQMEPFAEEDFLELDTSSWHEVIKGVDVVHEVLPDILPEQKSSSSSNSTRMTDYYKELCCFTEAKGAHSLLLGIWGTRGVGKTTLLRLVRDSYTGNACFDHIMFVGAGTGHVVTNVQIAIAIQLGLDHMVLSLDELSRAKHIFDYLEHKSFILLIDDIREPLNWWAIGLPLLSHRQKIIVATRTRAVCALMGCRTENTIEMQCLEKDDAWNLFRDTVGLQIISDHPQVHRLAVQMVSRCGGLPLALCALGRAMSNKRDPREWRSAYSRFMDVRLEPCEIDDKAVTSILNPL